ncbi:MAG: carbohydrate-binding domain-containing protein [Anaerolineae bacterium]|nr:carbohydrate-binding domain-containing protein [Anaerolineae bacterium]
MRNKQRTLRLIGGALLLSLLLGVLALTLPAGSAVSAQEPVTLVETHADPEDYVWDSADVTQIAISDGAITVDGTGATANGSTVTITAAGNYSFSGSLTDGQIIVDTEDDGFVRLILNGVTISNSSSAPIYAANADDVMIVLADSTTNVITDSPNYVFASAEEDEPNAAVFSMADLTIYGNGSLTVNANYNDGIASKDGLVIASGTITVNAVDDGVRGKDYLVIDTAALTISAGGDGLKSDNEEDAGAGYIAITNGTFNITAGGDAISAYTSVQISDGQFALVTGGGSTASIADTESAKGIKSDLSVQIDGGTFTINAADDALHSNGSVTINGGTLTRASNDEGVHADAALTVNGGAITITDSYEGIESAVITLNGGSVSLNASDDGVNASSGAAGTYLYINGGYLAVNASGDGLDANGAITMTGGVVVVNGPTEQMNGALDFDNGFTMTGGWLVAAGSAGMVQTLNNTSTQPSLRLNFTATQAAGTLVHIQSSDGTDVLTFAPSKAYQSITFSSPELTQGTYDVYLGGSADGTVTDGVYSGGSYTGGTLYTNFTVSSVITTVGSAGGMGMGGGRGGRGGRP